MPRVLVVADAPWVTNDVKSVLTGPDDEIYEVTDPRIAVDQTAELSPEVVVIDLQVGSMGGMAVTRALRDAMSSGRIGPTRLVMLLDRSADRFLAKRAGASEGVVKPFDAADLRRAVNG